MLVMGKAFMRFQRRALVPTLPQPTERAQGPDPFSHGSASEKRTSLRRKGHAVEVWIQGVSNSAIPTKGWVLDRSLGGVGLLSAIEFKKDAVVAVRTTNAPDTIPWVHVRVCRSASSSGSWELGCQFIKTPTWGTLLLFG